jgi:phenylalanyl-tRNA synthetase beta chain
VTREADLIEEVARLDGLEKLPATLPSRHGASGRLTPRQRLRRRAADALTAQGLHEIVGWSFTHPELADRLRLGEGDERRETVELENPISGDLSRLRTTMLGSLLDVARYNRARGAGTLRLFEAGAVYLPTEPGQPPREPYYAGALLAGAAHPPSWRDPQPRAVDFFAAKGVLQGLMDALRADWRLERAAEPFLHPGRAARILVAGVPAGWLGEVHPLVAAQWDLRDTVAAFELDLDTVPEPQIALYRELSEFPDVREDIAVVVPEHVTAAQLLALVRHAGGRLLADAQVFDVYRDPERLGEGNVSLALRLTYRAGDRTLTDEEVAERREAIAEAVADQMGGRIRAS